MEYPQHIDDPCRPTFRVHGFRDRLAVVVRRAIFELGHHSEHRLPCVRPERSPVCRRRVTWVFQTIAGFHIPLRHDRTTTLCGLQVEPPYNPGILVASSLRAKFLGWALSLPYMSLRD